MALGASVIAKSRVFIVSNISDTMAFIALAIAMIDSFKT